MTSSRKWYAINRLITLPSPEAPLDEGVKEDRYMLTEVKTKAEALRLGLEIEEVGKSKHRWAFMAAAELFPTLAHFVKAERLTTIGYRGSFL